MRRRFMPLVLTLMPAAALAQGRLISRPCASPPPTCRLDECVRPSTMDCGPQLERTGSVVKVGLSNRVLRYEVTETFRNRSQRVAEADYIFPLPLGAAFEDLKLMINGELVSGETMTADKARGIYEEIVRRQRDPALVEWMGSGMLRTRIFPIAPGEEKKVVVRFQAAAQREGDALRIDYRRGSNPNATGSPMRPVVEQRGMATESADWTSFSLLYERTADFGDAYSPTHTLRTRDEGRTREVEARGSASDVTILLPLRRPDVAAISVLTHAPDNDGGFALFTITPPSAARRALPRDVTFVIDVSGSMRGRKLEQAKEAGHVLLASLRSEDRFRIVDFSTDVRAFRDGFSAATRENVRDGRRYIDALVADGSTNISGALESALSTRSDGERLPLVVFMTDGEPTIGERSADRIAAMAARQRGDARVFAIGVSADVNAALIEQLSLEGHGTAHFVRDNESVERTVSLLATRLTSPVLTNVRVRVDGVQLRQVLPAGPIDVFAGQDMVVLARYAGSGNATVRLEGESVDGPVTWSTRARFTDRDRANPFVARLWAAQRIGWLAAEKRRNGGSSEVDGEIRTLGERYGIPTEFTSYLVVEPGMQVAGARDQSLSSRVDVMKRARTEGAATGQAGLFDKAQAVAPAAAPAPSLAANERRFEDARAAAKQREARSTAELDEAVAGTNARRVGERIFSLANGVWTDARYTTRLRTVTIKPYSAAYFELMKQLDQLAPLFALGDRVIIAGRAVNIELAPTGVERLSATELAAVVRDW